MSPCQPIKASQKPINPMKSFHSAPLLLTALVMAFTQSCSDEPENIETNSTVETSTYGTLPDKRDENFHPYKLKRNDREGHRAWCHSRLSHEP